MEYTKERSQFDLKVSEVVWFNEVAQAYLTDMFGKLLSKVQPSIRVLFRNPIRYENVRISYLPRYESDYVEGDDWGGYLPTYDVELRVGYSDRDRMVFRICYLYECLEFEYVDHVGNCYDTHMLRSELKQFLECTYKEVGQIHTNLYNETQVNVDDIGSNLYEI